MAAVRVKISVQGDAARFSYPDGREFEVKSDRGWGGEELPTVVILPNRRSDSQSSENGTLDKEQHEVYVTNNGNGD